MPRATGRSTLRLIGVATLCIATSITVSLSIVTPSHAADEWVYTVVPGDNLWTFSQRYLDSVQRFETLRRLNNIEQPRKMKPGTQIRVPMEWIRSGAVPAIVEAVSGAATLRRVSGAVSDIRVGDRAFLGDTIRTGDQASVAIRFADTSVLTLHANSEMRFDHLSAHGRTGMADSQLHLLQGRLDTRVKPAEGPGSRFVIQTPSAISAVRGTEYRAAVDPNAQGSSIEVLGGSVDVSGASDRQLIPRGYGTRVEQGKAPLPPKELLPPPELQALPLPVRSIGLPLQWKAPEGAVGYRLELSTSADFDTIIWDELTERNRLPLPDVPDGDYHLRLRAIDGIGLEGQETRLALTLDARPQAPVALEPPVGATLRVERVKLLWSDSAEAQQYRLEVSQDPYFSSSLIDQELKGTQFESAALAEVGTYHWRLSSIAADGEVGPAGPARTFDVKPRHTRLGTTLKPSGDSSFLATWQTAAPGLSYQVQIAHDRDFSEVTLDQVLQQPSLEIARSSKTRFLRVRSVEADGYAGPWSVSQRIAAEESGREWLIPLLIVALMVAL